MRLAKFALGTGIALLAAGVVVAAKPVTGAKAAQIMHERHEASDFETNTQDKIGEPEQN